MCKISTGPMISFKPLSGISPNLHGFTVSFGQAKELIRLWDRDLIF